MDSEKVKQYVPKLRCRLMTQEDCNRINNGGATQIVLNRRVKRPRSNKSNPTSSEVNQDG
jgi:hypothetical protein